MFTNETLTFLAELADNNEREWFNANKKRYEAHLKKPALSFIESFAPQLAEISPHFLAIPKTVGGSLFRIYNDTRFHKNKPPYKTHLGIQFRHAEASRDVHAPGFYLGIEPGHCMAGAGMWRPASASLRAVRQAIVDEPERWAHVKESLAAEGVQFMEGDTLKRAPKGFDASHRHIEDLRRKTFAVTCPVPEEAVTGPDLGQTVQAAYRRCVPLVHFLCDSQGVPF